MFADTGFAGKLVDWTRDTLKTRWKSCVNPQINAGSRSNRAGGSSSGPCWLTACRRLARDYERHPEVSEGIIRWAAIADMARRITRDGPARRQPRRTFNWD